MPAIAGLKSAAELARIDGAGERPFDPDLYRLGMRVWHPEYGVGTVVVLNRSGMRRQGTVVFDIDSQPRRFVLLHARMQPVVDTPAAMRPAGHPPAGHPPAGDLPSGDKPADELGD